MKKEKSIAAISPVMRSLAAYMARACARRLPSRVAEKTRHHLLDTLAAMISGSRLLPGRRAIAYVKTLGGRREAAVIGSKYVTTAVNAALANGMHAHADETDDSHSAALMHPGCAVVAAALATAERERCGGNELLRAVALGYDVAARMSMLLGAKEFSKIGHSSNSFGPLFGAAAASAALCGLNQREVRYALSYTAQQASGISCMARDRDHIEKAFDFGGMTARNGVTAATMVAAGCTGVDDVFSGERNFFTAFDESGRHGIALRPESLVDELGTRYEVMNTSIKRWSVGSPMQAALDSLLALIREHRLHAADVESMSVRIYTMGAKIVNGRDMPDVNVQHMCALMLVDGGVTFDSAHDLRRMRDPRVLALRRRIELIGDDELEKLRPSKQAIVELLLKDGRRLRHHTQAVRGTPYNPMGLLAEVEEKAYGLIAPVTGKRCARQLCETIRRIETVNDVRGLRPLLRA